MKVYVAKVVGWEDHEVLGVFTSRAMAEARIKKLFDNLLHPDEVDIVEKIDEFELDEDTPSIYENGSY